MTEALGHPHAANALHFPSAEWEQLQADDRHAAVVVLGLMTGIFSIGLVLYTIVLLSVL
ncbi:MAG TPA: hypothetical protein VKA46_09795 [Gemmataceae bacterium]|nr:hypothetical protein [Gemmataceae bacterium]